MRAVQLGTHGAREIDDLASVGMAGGSINSWAAVAVFLVLRYARKVAEFEIA